MDYDEEQDAAGGNFDLQYWVSGVLRYRLLILLTTACGLLIALFQAVQKPDEYFSEGSLFVRPGAAASLTPESAFIDNSGSRMSSRDWVMNELSVLDSPLLFKKAVRIAGVDTILTPSSRTIDPSSVKGRLKEYAGSISEWMRAGDPDLRAEVDEATRERNAALLLAARSSIRAKPRTTVISISTTADGPLKAQEITNALLEAAVELHSEVGENMGSLRQVEAELAKTEQVAVDAEYALDQFLREHAIFDFSLQKSSMAEALLQQKQLVQATALDLARTESENQFLTEASKDLSPTRSVAGSGGWVLNPQVAILEGTIEQLRMRRYDLEAESARMAISVPERRERLKAIEALEKEANARLLKEPQQLSLDATAEENPEYVAVMDGLRERRVKAIGLKVLESGQQDSLNKTQAELERLGRLESEWRSLSAAAERKRFVYRRLLDSVSNMQAVRRLEQQKLSNLQVMHHASFNPLSVGPGRMKVVLIGTFAGLGVGLLCAAAFVYLGSRIQGAGGLMRGGVEAERVYSDAKPSKRPASWAVAALPESIAQHAETVKSAVNAVSLDRDSSKLTIAATGCSDDVDVSRAAGELAVGLSALLGESVVLVSCSEAAGWLASRLGLAEGPGWLDVLSGRCGLDDAVMQTEVRGLSYLAVSGEGSGEQPRMVDAEFRDMLNQLAAQFSVVIVEAPSISIDPSCQSVLRAVDSVQLVVRDKRSTNDELTQALKLIKDCGASIGCCCLQSY